MSDFKKEQLKQRYENKTGMEFDSAAYDKHLQENKMNEITAGMKQIMDCITKNQETSNSLLELIKDSNRKLLELAAQVDVLEEEVIKLKRGKITK